MSRIEVNPKVQPFYEHIAVAEPYQLDRLEGVLTRKIRSTDISHLDEYEIRLLLKAVSLRRRELAALVALVGKEILDTINNRFAEATR